LFAFLYGFVMSKESLLCRSLIRLYTAILLLLYIPLLITITILPTAYAFWLSLCQIQIFIQNCFDHKTLKQRCIITACNISPTKHSTVKKNVTIKNEEESIDL
jgi:hypothetical protein